MASDITPNTGTFTLTGIVLGEETYEQTVQNALAHNTGYLLYAPRVLCCSDETWDIDSAAGTQYGLAYMLEGTYDLQAAIYQVIGTGAGSAYVYIARRSEAGTLMNGTLILASKHDAPYEGVDTAGTVAGFLVGTSDWYNIWIAANGTTEAEIRAWSVQARQKGV